MKTIKYSIIALCIASATQFVIKYLLQPVKPSKYSQYFSQDYYHAREKFRNKVQTIPNTELHSIPISDKKDFDLTIDIAIVKSSNSSKKMLIHVSGTHGVEGYAGSAIQCHILDSLATQNKKKLDSPTIIFIHALNPYGMAFLRRWNENNVDLNRNFLSPNKFNQKVNSDPNAFGYVDFYHLFNSQTPPSSFDFVVMWIKALYYIPRFGYQRLKQALVTGNYHFSNSIFFGGQELQPSLAKLENFFISKINLEQIDHLAIIDVHTGLGPKSHDSLMVEPNNYAEALALFGESTKYHSVIAKLRNDKVSSGYNHVEGYVPLGMQGLFPSLKSCMPLTQEFGTVNGVQVLLALRAENAAFHFGTHRLIPYGQAVRNTFYLHEDEIWKNAIVERGFTIFDSLYEWLLLKNE